jgi:transposase
MRPTGSAAELARRRRGAVIRLRKGERVIDVAASLGVSTTAVQNWKRAAAEGGGLRALRAKPQHVLTCRLSADQKRELRKILVRGAAAAGYATDLWTCDRVAEVVEQRFGVSYHPGHISRILHDIGFSCQKPARRARERNATAVKKFRSETWPSIKKGRKKTS